ncbi:hypothetical protein C5167_011617 [Papaver somniferum]|uniref:Uncharacterized protein n=1 Tax=Papaver somniferum TaxID=3469 RepID=A0A4Y7K4T5_PAPSO|nr:hypothetical protein C5167_011617 [Papaver somniferum]
MGMKEMCIPVVSTNGERKAIALCKLEIRGTRQYTSHSIKKGGSLLRAAFHSHLTCILRKKYILADPNSEEESGSPVTMVLDSSNRLISLFEPGGPFLASTSVVQGYTGGSKDRVNSERSHYRYRS